MAVIAAQESPRHTQCAGHIKPRDFGSSGIAEYVLQNEDADNQRADPRFQSIRASQS